MKIIASVACALAAGTALGQIVSRDISDPKSNTWKESDWVSASGSLTTGEERAPDAIQKGGSLRVTVSYPAKTFAHWGLVPEHKKLPGNVKSISAWTRSVQGSSAVELVIKDADGKEKKFGLPVNKDKPDWRSVEIKIPDTMPQPLTLESIAIHNWGDRNNPEAATVVFDICDLRVFTDVSDIPLEERPYSVAIEFPATGNIFYKGEKPVATLAATSWLGDERTLEINARVVSSDGTAKEIKRFTCKDSDGAELEMPFAEPGAYTLEAEIKGFPETKKISTRYVVCLEPPQLTAAQKQASPYGINIHGGTYVGYERFARLGFVWLRDYAFTYDWMTNARGEGAYAGWPWYPKILNAAKSYGLLTLPCLMRALEWDPKKPDSPVEPTEEWRRQIALIVATFPEITAWELDNEVEFRMPVEAPAYAAYHKVFGEIIHAISPKTWSVEQGAAGIFPELLRKNVLDGSFDDIDVVNGHRYCGIDAPETSKSNANTGQGEAKQTFLRDVFRQWKAAACADGKNRQVWITEFGWDTRAGQIVTEWQQAAYLQRGYLLSMANGVDKIFWYWYYDSDTDNPQNFFDGCGIFDRFRQPKPVAAAFTAMRAFLPADMKYVGYANLSPNAMAQVFEINGKYIAAAFKVDIEGADFTIDNPKADAVYDMFGATVDAKKPRKLDIAPTWYIGLDKNSAWLAQTPVDVESDHFVRSVAGETIPVATSATGDYSIKVPEGWDVEKTGAGFNVAAPKGTPRGSAELFVTGANKGQNKVMKIDVDIVPEAYARSFAVGFDGTFKVDVVNQSAVRKTHTVIASLPAGWEVKPAQQDCTLDPEEKASLSFTLAKSTPVDARETKDIPQLLVQNDAGMTIDAVPVVPREWRMKRMAKPTLDGDLKDWPADTQMPAWMLGPRGSGEASKVYMGYAPEGLYLGFDITDSKCRTSDPRSFWRAADCLELMFNPEGTFESGKPWGVNDHQFWFCPLADENRAYAGFWARAKEQETVYDIQDIQTAVKQNDTGYTMEIFIPAGRIHGFKPQKGTAAALSFTLAVQGHRDAREIFWPASKADNMVSTPWMWGRVILD